jgi:hypothetical protein
MLKKNVMNVIIAIIRNDKGFAFERMKGFDEVYIVNGIIRNMDVNITKRAVLHRTPLMSLLGGMRCKVLQHVK